MNLWIYLSLDYDCCHRYIGKTRPENLLIVLGSISLLENPYEIDMTVDQVYTHPKYNATAIDNDVALLRLSHPVTLGQTVQPICLPGPNEDLNRFRVCVDTGFGRTLRDSKLSFLKIRR